MAVLLGTAANETLTATGASGNTLNGNGGDDVMTGGNGNDIFDVDYGTLVGTASGVDIMIGAGGNDTYYVDNVSDQVVEISAAGGFDIIFSEVSYTLSTNVENLTLTLGAANGTGNASNNVIIGTSGNNTLDGGVGADILDGFGGGGDTFILDNVGDVILNVSATDTDISSVISSKSFIASGGDGTLINLSNVTLTGLSNVDATGNGKANILIGNAASNVLDGGAANGTVLGDGDDTLDGGGGADTMIGQDGDDTYYVDNVNDVITETTGADTIKSTISVNLGNANYAGVENLVLIGTANINGTASNFGNAIQGNSGRNVLTGGTADDILSSGVLNTGAAGDTMSGGLGDDTYIVFNSSDRILENALGGEDTVIIFTDFDLSATAIASQEIENLVLAGAAISGKGNALNNDIVGNNLDNTLDGGVNTAGIDTLVGGDGDDTFIVRNAGDFIDEILDQGTDTVQAGFSYVLTTFVENLVLTGTGNINGTGNIFGNTITGNSGNNILDGGLGVDTLIGGNGNDTYVVDELNDVVTETGLLSGGTDTVNAATTYTLGDSLENLVLTGALDIDGTGNGAANIITGNSGNNTLDGGGGNDALSGGLGDDTYILDAGGDTVFEAGGAGTDTIVSGVSVNLFTAGFGEIENVTLTGSGNLNATGLDGVVNVLTGNTGNNTLDGKGGADTMIGDAGDDVYIVDDPADTVTEILNSGTDEVQSSVSFDLSAFGDNVENLTLTGGAANGTGNDLDNTLTGNAVANVLTGGLGDDTYVVGAGDTVGELVGEGTDTISTNVTFDLSASAANVENLTLTGAAVINGTGDAGDNTLTGNSAANILTGGAGNDTYFVGTGDTVVELAGGGTDTVVSSANFTLNPADEVENLMLIGAAVSGTGDNSANVITGNAVANTLTGLGGDDTIDGGTGNDRMVGGLGDDLFLVDSTTDIVVELAGEGVADEVQSTAANYTLSANIEALTLLGTGNINGAAGAGIQGLTGNSGNNSLDGGLGADFMIGGGGDDTFAVDDLGDTVIEGGGGGTDTVRASITLSIAALANIENLVLTGTLAINGTGNAGANTLVGNTGINTLTGGAGDDTYYVGSNDTVVELVGGGTDTLIVTLTSGTYTVPANFENIIIVGKGNVSLTGDLTSNTLTGNDGRNTLDGGGGADVLTGGKGNDVYIVDDSLDSVIEAGGEGTDTVRASADFTLTANVERLILTGIDNINGTGNNEDNKITGNTGNNTLDGGAGTDTLIGGAGNDAYVVDTLRDTISDTSGNDTVITGLAYTLKSGLENLDLIGTDDVNGTGNSSVNLIVGNEGANSLLGLAGADMLYGGGTILTGGVVSPTTPTGNDILDGGAGADIMVGGDGDDSYFVDNAGDVIIDLTGDGDDSLFVAANFTLGVANEIETIIIGGNGNYTLNASDTDNEITGNAAVNRIFAMAGEDTIDGGAGGDTIDGGAGDDLLFGGTGSDDLIGGLGADTFLFDNATAFDVPDVIRDFNVGDGDIIDIADLLGAYDPLTDTLSDFVQITDSGPNSILRIDIDGAVGPAHFDTIAVLRDVTGLTGEAALVASGNLIVS